MRLVTFPMRRLVLIMIIPIMLVLSISLVSDIQHANANAIVPTNHPLTLDMDGNLADRIEVGHVVIIRGTFHNYMNYSQPFTTLFDVLSRDDENYHAYGFVGGQVDPDKTAEVFVSWIPERMGSYQVRQFDFSNLQNLGIIAIPSTVDITVVHDTFSSSIHE